ncbi:MAG: hypothetical protein FJ095_12430 [Deltaproteobacteria bacterium]|nr:hypothetical protein [Deltaproteobacteria bacterium]
MRALFVLAAMIAALTPSAAYFVLVARDRRLARQLPLLVSASASGLVGGVIAAVLERFVQRLVELDAAARTASTTWLVYGFAVSAPLEMALITGAMAPFWLVRRSRRSERWSARPTDREGMLFATAAALGFGVLRHGLAAWSARSFLMVPRLLGAGVGLALLASLWGYVLGREPDRGFRARQLARVWFGSALFLAVQDELFLYRGPQALLASLPFIVFLVGTVAFLWREPEPALDADSRGSLSLFLSAPAPSIHAIREAFRREDRPLTARWLSVGVLVNAGVVLSGVLISVMLGRRAGVDFAAIDRVDGGAEIVVPVATLATGALAAFPVAGYLIARAAGTRSVLEPAMSSGLAMLLLLGFFGLLAPAAIVFVIAVTPIAFGLSCAGAWFGTAR